MGMSRVSELCPRFCSQWIQSVLVFMIDGYSDIIWLILSYTRVLSDVNCSVI